MRGCCSLRAGAPSAALLRGRAGRFLDHRKEPRPVRDRDADSDHPAARSSASAPGRARKASGVARKYRHTLDIDPEIAGGFPEDVQSVVQDNARHLRIQRLRLRGGMRTRFDAKFATLDNQARWRAIRARAYKLRHLFYWARSACRATFHRFTCFGLDYPGAVADSAAAVLTQAGRLRPQKRTATVNPIARGNAQRVC